MTVTEAFETFKSQLELPDRRQKEAARIQEELRERIAKHLFVPRSFLSGSYARYTKIDPLVDIDVILVRNEKRVGLSTDGSGVLPRTALEQLADAVRKAYGNSQAKSQSRSVNVRLPGIPFGFDLVPAWLRHPDGYWIPDTDFGSWLPTDPDAHADLMTQANKQCDNKLKPLIKMVKHWSRNNHDLIRSFHIELICNDIFARQGHAIPSYQFAVAKVLVSLPQYIGQAMSDPIYGSSRVDRQLSSEEFQRLHVRVVHDAQNAVDALTLENAVQNVAAVNKWKQIFLHGFPS